MQCIMQKYLESDSDCESDCDKPTIPIAQKVKIWDIENPHPLSNHDYGYFCYFDEDKIILLDKPKANYTFNNTDISVKCTPLNNTKRIQLYILFWILLYTLYIIWSL